MKLIFGPLAVPLHPFAALWASRLTFARVILRQMVTLLMRYLTLWAMMASVVEAQCVISCAFQSISSASSTQHDPIVASEDSGHSCCPPEGNDAECPNSGPTQAEVRLDHGGPVLSSFMALDSALPSQRDRTPVVLHSLKRSTGVEPASLDHPSSCVSILRV